MPAPTILRTLARLLLQAIIAACLLIAMLIIGLQFWPELALLPTAVSASRDPNCRVWDGVRGSSIKVKQNEIAGSLKSRSRKLQESGGLTEWETPEGNFWILTDGNEVLFTLLAQQVRGIYGEVRSGDIVLDCGAHVGVFTRKALKAGARKVVAVEPSPMNVEALRRNFANEINDGRVIVYPKGVWHKEDTLVFYENENGGAGDSFIAESAQSGKKTEIPVTTVDRIVEELHLPKVDLLKADVKGSAMHMLFGAERTVKGNLPRIVIATELTPDDPDALFAVLRTFNPAFRKKCGPCVYDGDSFRMDSVTFEK